MSESKPFTDAEIANLTRLMANATPGPWDVHKFGPCHPHPVHGTCDPSWDILMSVAARNALPRLLAERAADKEEIKQLNAWAQHCHLCAIEGDLPYTRWEYELIAADKAAEAESEVSDGR